MLVNGGGGGVDLCSIYDRLPQDWRKVVGEIAVAELVKKLVEQHRYSDALDYAFYAPKGFAQWVIAEWLKDAASKIEEWIKSGAKDGPPVSIATLEELRSRAMEAGATSLADAVLDLENTVKDVEAYKWLEDKLREVDKMLKAASNSVDALIDAMNDGRFDDAARVLLNISSLFRKASDELRRIASDIEKRFGHRKIADEVARKLIDNANSLEYASEAFSHAATEVAAVGQLISLAKKLDSEPSLLYDDRYGSNVVNTYRVLAREYVWLMNYTGPGADLVQEIASYAKHVMDSFASFIANNNPDLYAEIARVYSDAGLSPPVSLSGIEEAEAEIREKVYPILYRLEELYGRITGFLRELAEATEKTWSKSGWVKLFSILSPLVWAGYYLASIPEAALGIVHARLEQLMALARGDYSDAISIEEKLLRGLIPSFKSIPQGIGFILSLAALASLASSAADAAAEEAGGALAAVRSAASRLLNLMRVFDILMPEIGAAIPIGKLLAKESVEPEAVLAELGDILREENIAVAGRGAELRTVISDLASSLGVSEEEAASALLRAIRDAAKMRTETEIAMDLAALRDIAERLRSLEQEIRSGNVSNITVVTEAEKMLNKLIDDLRRISEEVPSLAEPLMQAIERIREMRRSLSRISEELGLNEIVAIADKLAQEIYTISKVCPECEQDLARGDIASALARIAAKTSVREAVEIGNEIARLYDELTTMLAKIAPGVPVPKMRIETEIPSAIEKYAARLFLERHPELYNVFPDAAKALDAGDISGFAKAIERYVNSNPEMLRDAIKIVNDLIKTMNNVVGEVKGYLTEGEASSLERAERILYELDNGLKKMFEHRVSPTIVETINDLKKFLDRIGRGDVAKLLDEYLESGDIRYIDKALKKLASSDRSAEALLAYELYRAGIVDPNKYGFIVGKIGVYDVAESCSPPPDWLRELMNGGTTETVLRIGGREYRLVREVDIAPGKTTIRYRVETPEGWWSEYVYTITSDGRRAATAELLRYDPDAPPAAVAELEKVLDKVVDSDSSVLRNLVVIVDNVPVRLTRFGFMLRSIASILSSNEGVLWRKLLGSGNVVKLPSSIAPTGIGIRIGNVVFTPVPPSGGWTRFGRFSIDGMTYDLPYLGEYNGMPVFGIPTININDVYMELKSRQREKTEAETGAKSSGKTGEETGEQENAEEKTKSRREKTARRASIPIILPPFIKFLGFVGLGAGFSVQREVLVL